MASFNYYRNKNSKYNAIKTKINGIVFDSKKEANRYCELKILEKANEIKDLELQPTFLLQESFKKNGKTFRKIEYIADFKYFDIKKNKIVIEDIKGVETDVFKLKRKLFEYKYKDYNLQII